MSTPRPSGDQAAARAPGGRGAGATSPSTSRFTSEYSTSVGDQRHPPAGMQRRGPRRLPPRVVGDPDVAGPPRRHRALQRRQGLLQRRLVAPGVDQPQVDVIDVPSRGQRRVELGRAAPGARCRPPARRCAARCRPWCRPPPPSRGTRSPSSAPSSLLGGAVAVRRAPVSTRCRRRQERPRAGRAASCTSVSRPQVIVPRPSRETAQAGPSRLRLLDACDVPAPARSRARRRRAAGAARLRPMDSG